MLPAKFWSAGLSASVDSALLKEAVENNTRGIVAMWSELHASRSIHVFPEPVVALFFQTSKAWRPYAPTCDPRITLLCLFMCTAITHGWNVSRTSRRRAKSLSPSRPHVCNRIQADNQCCAYWVTGLWHAGYRSGVNGALGEIGGTAPGRTRPVWWGRGENHESKFDVLQLSELSRNNKDAWKENRSRHSRWEGERCLEKNVRAEKSIRDN